jgi:DNA (cytosine-5)-methyltransferase 1
MSTNRVVKIGSGIGSELRRTLSTNGLTYASLFCGCGGFDLGFELSGFKCIAAFDIDPIAVAVHRINLKSPAQVCDLSKEDVPFHYAIKNLDVIIAGTPCQGFSTAGKRNYDDPRNRLLISAGRIAIAAKPRVFILENVPTVNSGTHSVYWRSLLEMLKEAGYRIHEYLCDAFDIGLSQIRKRLFLFAWDKEKDICITFPSRRGGDLEDALVNINDAPDHYIKPLPRSGQIYSIAKRIKPGQKVSNVRGGPNSIHTWDIPEVFGVTTSKEKTVLITLMYLRRRLRIRQGGDADPVSLRILKNLFGTNTEALLDSLGHKGYIRRIGERYDLTHTFNGKFRRMRWDRPSLTVDTRFGEPRYFLHPKEHRGFSIREAARIQGFPDSFRFCGSERAQYRLIGNAVPPPVGTVMAEFVRRVLLNKN